MRQTRLIRGAMTVLVAAGLVAFLGGCSGDNSPTTAAEAALSSPAVVPTDADLVNLLGLNQEQKQQMSGLLAQWRQEQGQMGGQFGDRQRDRDRDRDGDCDADCVGPMGQFLRGSAGVLTPDQMVTLGKYLTEKREQRRAEMHARFEQRRAGGEDRPGPGFGEGRGGRGMGERGAFLNDLDLTPEQRTQLREAMQTMRAAMRSLMERYRNGEIDAAGMRDGQKALEQNRIAVMQGILTAEQFQAWQEHRQERQQQMVERMQDRSGDHEARMIAFLTDVLHLDEAQVTALEAVLADSRTAREALIARFAAGEIDKADLHYEMTLLREATQDAIRALLNEEQVAVFEALEPLAPGGRKHHRSGR